MWFLSRGLWSFEARYNSSFAMPPLRRLGLTVCDMLISIRLALSCVNCVLLYMRNGCFAVAGWRILMRVGDVREVMQCSSEACLDGYLQRLVKH